MKSLCSTNLPLISIVTVVYNGERYLEKTIQSVINQKYKNYEYIIIDGGSTDGTIDIIKKYEINIKYWVSEPDKGQSDALNKGIKYANGEVIGWLNADDYFLPNAFTDFVNFYHKHNGFDFYYANYNWVDKNSKLLKVIKPLRYYSRFLNSFYGCYIPTSGSFIKKRFFLTVGDLSAEFKYKMDTDIFDRCHKHDVKFKKIDDVLSAFRFHGENVSFRDKDREDNLISKQELESIIIKDRTFKFKLPLRVRNIIYKMIWYYARSIYLIMKYVFARG